MRMPAEYEACGFKDQKQSCDVMEGGDQEEEVNVGCQVLMRRPPLLLGYWMLNYLKNMTLCSLSGRINSLRSPSSCQGSMLPTNLLLPETGRLRRWSAASFLEQIRRNNLRTDPARVRVLKPASVENYDQQHVVEETSSSRSNNPIFAMDRNSSGSPIHIKSTDIQGANGDSSSDEISSLDWSIFSSEMQHLRPSPATLISDSTFMWEQKRQKRETDLSEVEMMKERFARLLLGEDTSGGGKGVCTALAISNAITKLAASVFGELWKLEPLSLDRKTIWRREMEWLLSVCDHILEFVPSSQSFPDGSNLEVMISRPRSDLHVNLPALRKIDTMLLESLESFKESEFWYVDQDILVFDRNHQHTERFCHQRHREKWWLPTPKLPISGLSAKTRKKLQYQRECTNQILKAAMSINCQTLAEMEVPDLYWQALPKSAKSCLGEALYWGLNVEQFYPDGLLSQLDLPTVYSTLEIANHLESAILIWHRRADKKQLYSPRDSKPAAKSSWGKMKDLVGDAGKANLLAENAESLLLLLRQRFPGLPQTVLHISKVQYNRDVGQAILESYSRVLQSLAFSITCRIEEIISMDSLTAYHRLPGKLCTGGASSNLHKGLLSAGLHPSVSPSYATPFASPDYSPRSSNFTTLPSSPLNHRWLNQSNKNDGSDSNLRACNDSLQGSHKCYSYSSNLESWDSFNNLSPSSCD